MKNNNITFKLSTLIYKSLFIISFCSSMLSAADPNSEPAINKTIKIVTERSYPLNYTNKNDPKLRGFATELIQAVMIDAGLKYEITIKPWARVLNEAIANKDTLIYSVGRTQERENKLLWIGEIITVKNNIYGLRNALKNSKVSLSDLKNANISVSKHSLNYNYLKSKNFKHLISVSSYEQTYQLLKRGRTQFFTSSVLGAHQFIIRNNLKAEDIIPVMRLQEHNPVLYLAANVDTNPKIIRKLKTSFQKIIDNGTYDRIMQPLLEDQSLLRDLEK